MTIISVLEGITISQKNFNVDMDTYLSRRKKPVSKKTKPKPKAKVTEKEFKEEELEYYKREKNMIDKFLDFILGEKKEPEVKEIEDIEEEIEEQIIEEEEFEEELDEIQKEDKKISFFTRLKQLFFFGDDEEDVLYDEELDEPIIDEEIKEVLKIQNKWLTKLSAKEIKKFKESSDYSRYVEILEKHNLLKK